ncbi:hypothetical protein IV203_018674 [Nitzschia inconspicua]|uniref:Uncharacterized protein n=1 Tax=Nitzschia inconspicua TaxID=303405 RepID=A0A9K3M3X7_9STRA|nr:hypothetical protein IV203_018674 [Nitzschia inconspicua]
MSVPTFIYPHDPLTPIIGRPTAPAIILMTKEIFANAKSVPSKYGSHGHLALVMTTADYTARAGQAYTAPTFPIRPTHVASATTAQINNANQDYADAVSAYDKHISVQQNLKQQILNAVEPIFTKNLDDKIHGYADVTPQELLTHLTTKYGTITDTDLEDNRKKLNTSQPIPEATAISSILQVFAASGVLDQYINEWKRKPAADKTYDNFQEHFESANLLRLQELTTKQAGFHSANFATPPNAPATASAAPTSSNSITVNSTTMYYCWSHGLGFNPNHTSATCQRPSEKHDHTATIRNPKGGCRLINTAAFRRSPS